MLAWRIAKAGDIDDLSGAGASTFGGRWNHPDRPALYLHRSLADCALETLLLAGPAFRLPLNLMTLKLPDDPALYQQPKVAELPTNWHAVPADSPGMDFGSAWLDRGEALGLILPSVATGQAGCLMINPAHPAASQIRVLELADFHFGQPSACRCG